MKKRRRLNLLEIILAVSIILVLAAILFPVQTGKEPSPKAACLSNLKQLALGNLIYAADYDDRFPDRDIWMDVLEPYTRNKGIQVCPTIKELNDPSLYGYCFHSILSKAKSPPNPENVELVFDSINLARNASGTPESLPKPGRHDGINNIAYADGSAKPVPVL